MFERLRKAFRSLIDRMSRRLVNKLILFFSTIIILVVGSLTIISYQMIQKESVDYNMSSTANNLKLVNQNLEDYLAGIEQLSLPQIRYDELIRAILNEEDDYASKMYLEDYLRSLFYSRKDLNSIYLYLVGQGKYYSITQEAYDIKVRVGYDGQIPYRSWYKKAMASPNNRSYQSFADPGADPGYSSITDPGFMAYHRVIRSIASKEARAVISFYLKPSMKDEIMKDIPFENGEHLLFLDPDNVPFHLDDLEFYNRLKQTEWLTRLERQEEQEPITWTTKDKEKYLIVYNVGEQNGWKLIKPIPYSNIYEAARKTRDLNYLIGLVFLVISVILVTLIANAITQPLKRLSHQMRRFSEGTFDVEAPVKGRDELAYLTRHFNRMVTRTNDLINERYKMKLVEKNAILKALEAEINPHFLYNALQAISTKALKSGDFEVADMVDALALTLRYCISGKDIVYAKEELGHIDRYLALQKARFGSRLEVTLEWDDSLMELQIPKLSIQSLVENSIKHAVEKVSVGIRIKIRAELEESRAVITVEDNGPGIPPARMEEILESFRTEWEEQEGENIGLKNLNTRLKLLYGEEAGLEIQSGDTGTRMRMLIPRGGQSHV
ncbi:two-component system sensor histidine kinase YesM [Fontibacillus phaseoli]|uniref:histidine kinase n=1 Tax=Fontibacillus phaseoli TaxID=1416533 RepID=A0A369B5K9_9BACL|nr:sensor histidine kinase [Fontibacillus phaseoli]RCX16731.1 two-component system sensor histidine kinase YesM [Fontibacillus phaseoli]